MTQGAQAVTQATSQVATAVASGSPIGVSASLSGKIFSNIKYLNISYPEELLEAFETWDPNLITIGFQPDIPDSVKEKIVNQPVPYMFSKYELESSFLINFWQVVSVLVIVSIIFGVIRFFELISKQIKKRYLPHSYCRAVRVAGQNFLLTQLYSVFGDLIFYSVLEWRSINTNTDYSWLSLSIAILLYGIMFLSFMFHLKLIFNYQRIRNKSAKLENSKELTQYTEGYEGCEVLFRDFSDESFIHQGFLFFFTLRDIALSLVFTMLFDYPLTQATLIFLQNLGMILYLLIKKPFASKLDLIQQLFFEVLIFCVNTSVFIMALMDSLEIEGIAIRNVLGKSIIIICMVFSFTVLGFIALKLIISIKYGYQAFKKYLAKRKLDKTTKKLSQNISQDPSISFNDDISNIQLSRDDSLRRVLSFGSNSKVLIEPRNKPFEQDSIDEASSARKILNNENPTNVTTQASLLENSASRIYYNFKEKFRKYNKTNMRNMQIHPSNAKKGIWNVNELVQGSIQEKSFRRVVPMKFTNLDKSKESIDESLTINLYENKAIVDSKISKLPSTAKEPTLQLEKERGKEIKEKWKLNKRKDNENSISQSEKRDIKEEKLKNILSLDLSPIKIDYLANPKKKFEF